MNKQGFVFIHTAVFIVGVSLSSLFTFRTFFQQWLQLQYECRHFLIKKLRNSPSTISLKHEISSSTIKSFKVHCSAIQRKEEDEWKIILKKDRY